MGAAIVVAAAAPHDGAVEIFVGHDGGRGWVEVIEGSVRMTRNTRGRLSQEISRYGEGLITLNATTTARASDNATETRRLQSGMTESGATSKLIVPERCTADPGDDGGWR